MNKEQKHIEGDIFANIDQAVADGQHPSAQSAKEGNAPADKDGTEPTEPEMPAAVVADAAAPAPGTKAKKKADAAAPDAKAERQPDETSAQPAGDTAGEGTMDAIKDAIKEQAREDERPMSASFGLRTILGGDWLTADLLRRQLGVLLLIVVFVIIYVNNRYSCQKDMLEIDRLNVELKDAKYRALSSTSELTEKCRESNVLRMLKTNKDSVLRIPNQPPYIVEVPE